MNTRHITAASCALAALLAYSPRANAQNAVVLPSTGLTLDAPFPVRVEKQSNGDVITRADRSKPALSVSLIPNPSNGDRGACEKVLGRLKAGTQGASWAPSNLIVNGAWQARAVYFEIGSDNVAVVCLSDAETYVQSMVRYSGDFHDVDFDQGRALMVAMTDMIFGPSDTRELVHHLATSRVMLEEPGETRLEVESGRHVDVIARKDDGPEFVIELERSKRPSCDAALEARAKVWAVEPSARGLLAPPSWHERLLVVAADVPVGLVGCVDGEEGRFLATLYYRGSWGSRDYRSRVSAVLRAISVAARATSARPEVAAGPAILRPRINLGDGELDFRKSLGVKVREVPGVQWSYQDRPKGLRLSRRGDPGTSVLVTRAKFPGYTCSSMLEQLARGGKFGALGDAPYLPPSWHGRAITKVDAKGLKGSACLDLPDDQGAIFASMFSDDPDLTRPGFVSTYGVMFAHIAHAYGVSKGPRSWMKWDRMGL